MRQLRLVITLLFALTLLAQGLIGHAARAHLVAAAAAVTGLCIPAPGEGDQHRGRDCLSHCLTVATPETAPPPAIASLLLPSRQFAETSRPGATAPRLTHILHLDHAPRAPPAVA
ncbi:MAG: hypothetical protein Q8S29_12230 [Phreatobacter sp.]|nr:hypothetical protein [Phreatobacter sp.]